MDPKSSIPVFKSHPISPGEKRISIWNSFRIQSFRLSIIISALCICAGCASVNTLKQPEVSKAETQPVAKSAAGEIAKTATSVTKTAGIIFGKADFRGLLKVEYVKLNIVDEQDPEKQYKLLFGERDENNAPIWDARPIEPHYFFLELPVGKYRITAISIPVGTTLATEPTDIAFTVQKDSVIYLGTLRVTGTDQKIRFGAVPLMRPGFEYRVEILNEIDEAVGRFRSKYPSLQRDIQVQLMRAIRIQSF